jgi:hypothetical protein
MSMTPRHTQPGNSKLRMACSACCLFMRSQKSSFMATAPLVCYLLASHLDPKKQIHCVRPHGVHGCFMGDMFISALL